MLAADSLAQQVRWSRIRGALQIQYNQAGNDGGGIWNSGEVEFIGGHVSYNHSSRSGGALWNSGHAALSFPIVSGNSADEDGGGIWNSGHIDVMGVQSGANDAGGNGGSLWNSGTVNLNGHETFGASTATNGGVIWNSGILTYDVNDFDPGSDFNFGRARQNGGGIWNSGTVTLDGLSMYGSFAAGDGGAIWSSGTLTLTRSHMTESSAGNDGGGIWNSGQLSLSGENTNYYWQGHHNTARNGGLLWNSGNATLVEVMAINNTALQDGGGIWNSGSLNAIASDVINNTASGYGGGVYNAGQLEFSDGGIVLPGYEGQFMVISSNSATHGGGLWNSGSTTLTNSILRYNTASASGGAILNTANAQLSIDRSTLHDNSATTQGGSVNNSGALHVLNSTLHSNASGASGGAIHSSGMLDLVYSTIAYNTSATGAAVDSTSLASESWIVNTIVALDFGNDLNGTYRGTNNWIGDGSGEGLVATRTGDPRFVNLLDMPFYFNRYYNTNVNLGIVNENNTASSHRYLEFWGGLTPTLFPSVYTSGLINAGVVVEGVSTDQRGMTRDSTPDIGACDTQSPPRNPPLVAVDAPSVSVIQGQVANNTGTLFDPDANDYVSITSDVGYAYPNGDGTWSWSLDTTSLQIFPTEVTITATDQFGLTTTASFDLVINDAPPVFTVYGQFSPVAAGNTATASGFIQDPGSFDTFTLTSSLGIVSRSGNGGNSDNWSLSVDTTGFAPGAYPVTVTATDNRGATSEVTLSLVVLAPPSVAVNAPTVTINQGEYATQTGTYTLGDSPYVSISSDYGSVYSPGDGTWSWSGDTASLASLTRTVTVTAQGMSGLLSTVTFDVIITDVAPVFTIYQNLSPTGAGNTASAYGFVQDPGLFDSFSITSSLGAVITSGNGGSSDYWYLNVDTTGFAPGSYPVTVTATDNHGVASNVTLMLVILAPPSVTVDSPTVTVNQGQMVTQSGTYSSADVDGYVTISSDVGYALSNGDGTWSWNADTTYLTTPTQVVTVTATDLHGLTSTLTFDFIVTNVAPVFTVYQDVSPTAAGNVASAYGFVQDPGYYDTLTITSSLGTLTTSGYGGSYDYWYLNVDTIGFAAGSYPVTITATDSNGGVSEQTLTLIVLPNNAAPTVASDVVSVTGGEGSVTSATGTFADAQGNSTVSFTASVGTIVKDDNAGTWSWSFNSNDGPVESQTVTITAIDDQGEVVTTTFNLIVNNVAPTATLSGEASAVYGTNTTFRLTGAFDPSVADAASLHFSFALSAAGLTDYASAGTSDSYNFSTALGVGNHIVYGRVLDKDGGFTDYQQTITVTPATISVTAASRTKVYGNADPALTYSATGFQFSDTAASVFSGGLSRAAGQNVGSYAITQGTLTAGSNYNVAYIGANLNITPAALTVTANSATKNVGQTDPAFTYAVSGLQYSDTATSVLSGALRRVAGETAGTYAILQGTLAANANYTITYVGANLNVVAVSTSGVSLQPDPLNPGMMMLVITGTEGNNEIEVEREGNWYEIEIETEGSCGSEDEQEFSITGTVSRIVIRALGGNDEVEIEGSITVPVWAYGGNGNDKLKGGANCVNLLFGEAGNDVVAGGSKRDILVGGTGADSINGSGADDILIAGYTTWDTNAVAMNSILAEWLSTRSYAARVANVRTGLGLTNGSRLNGNSGSSQTVFEDNNVDRLTGAAATDWFFANTVADNGGVLDILTDKIASESADDADLP